MIARHNGIGFHNIRQENIGSMIKRTHVRSFYTNILVTCYDAEGIKYVANQHGNWDVYEGEYMRGEKTRTVSKSSDEIRKIITQFNHQTTEDQKK
jgi:hypothetical protein